MGPNFEVKNDFISIVQEVLLVLKDLGKKELINLFTEFCHPREVKDNKVNIKVNECYCQNKNQARFKKKKQKNLVKTKVSTASGSFTRILQPVNIRNIPGLSSLGRIKVF